MAWRVVYAEMTAYCEKRDAVGIWCLRIIKLNSFVESFVWYVVPLYVFMQLSSVAEVVCLSIRRLLCSESYTRNQATGETEISSGSSEYSPPCLR